MLSPSPRTTAADLLRLAAAWLALILALQGFSAALSLGLGPLHRHAAAAHGHNHAGAERHHHFDDADHAVAEPDADWNAAAFAITAALALMAAGGARLRLPSRGRHVMRAAAPWVPGSAHTGPPERPPRRA